MPQDMRNKPIFQTPHISQKGRKWNVFRIAKKVIVRSCTALGALMLVSMFISASLAIYFSGQKVQPLPDQMVLLFPVEGPLLERQKPFSLQDPFPSEQLSIRQVTSALNFAKDDDRVKGVVLSIRSNSVGLSHVQEVRQAIENFRTSGKFVTSYSTTFGSTGNAFSSYYLAAASSEIWMQPMGTLAVSGINLELPFARGALDKIGITPQISKRKEYKSAASSLTDTQIDGPTREMMGSIVNDLGQQFVTDVAIDRQISEPALKKLIDQGILLDQEALSSGLIDRVDYSDVLVEELKAQVTGDPESDELKFVGIDGYASRMAAQLAQEKLDQQASEDKRPTVAVIHINGAIIPRLETVFQQPLAAPIATQPQYAAADDISKAIFEASRMDEVEAIVLRINSPGGSPTASETIRRAVVKAKQRGKRIITSMGATAASGGYWVTPDADFIVATPSTLTGSIGVVGGKFVINNLWDNLNIRWDSVSFGQQANIWSPNVPFGIEGQKRYNATLDQIYDGFVARVAQGRNMDVNEVDRIARGRAWTGQQALDVGLVDKLGTLNDAFDETAIMLGKSSRDDIRIITLPRQETLSDILLKFLQQQASLYGYISAVSQIANHESIRTFIHNVRIIEQPELFSTYSDLTLR